MLRATPSSSSIRAGVLLAAGALLLAGCGYRPYEPPPPDVQAAVRAALSGSWQGTFSLSGEEDRPVTLIFTAAGSVQVTVGGTPSAALPNPSGSGGWNVTGPGRFTLHVSAPTAPGTASGVTAVELSQDGTLDATGQRFTSSGQGTAKAGTTTVGFTAATITATKVAPTP